MIQIILNTIRNQLRKPNWFLFLMVFPMFLIYFISYILTNTFDSKNNLAPVNVCLLDESEGIATATIDTITSASRNITSSYGLIIKPIDSIEQGKIQARRDDHRDWSRPVVCRCARAGCEGTLCREQEYGLVVLVARP